MFATNVKTNLFCYRQNPCQTQMDFCYWLQMHLHLDQQNQHLQNHQRFSAENPLQHKMHTQNYNKITPLQINGQRLHL